MAKTKRKQSKILKRRKSQKVGIIVFLLCLLAGITVYAVGSSPRKIEIEYTVKPYSVEQKQLAVDIKIKPLSGGTSKTFVLAKGSMKTSDEKCTDNLDRSVNFRSDNGIIVIDKLGEGAEYLKYSYNVSIGGTGKHGDNGQIYQDLLTFAGESVLALPIRALNYDNPKEDVIKKITVRCSVPDSWESIIPYPKKDAKNTSEIENPDWLTLYELRQGSFTFGSFDKDIHMNSDSGYTVYIDPKARQYYDMNAKKGIESIYNYYCKLFGNGLNNYNIVLLRNNDETNNYIIGGVCTQNLASTFDSQNKRDWQLLSHRLFHSFFETKIPSDKFIKAPLLGFYEGLATYYENMSLNSLPQNIRDTLAISSDKEFAYLFERYSYMRLKEPKNLALVPSEENLLQESPARIEFLHYTQMPLTINYLEDLINKKTGKKDNILNFIIEKSSDNTTMVENIVDKLLGKDSKDFEAKYLNGTDIVPLWSILANRQESSTAVIKRLNEYEYDLYTWFRMENQLYKYDQLEETNLEKLAKEAEVEGACFADTDTEYIVKKSSPLIYELLKEYALRAKVCNIDYKDISLREKLLTGQSNLEKWDTFKKSFK